MWHVEEARRLTSTFILGRDQNNMPVECQITFEACDRDLYHDIDHVVKGMAFEIHNDFGRLLNEELYKRELVLRCAAQGLVMQQEARFWLRHGSFVKTYATDLVADNRVIFECKTADRLAPAHKAQVLNYLYLAGTQWGTLLNFGGTRVQHEYATTGLTTDERRRVIYNDSLWKAAGTSCQDMRDVLHALLADWGAFLEITAYRDALCHSIPGAGIQAVPFHSRGAPIGAQNLHLISEDVALIVSAVTRETESMRKHHLRLLAHTRLQAIQWINFNQRTIHLESLTQPLR